MTAKKEEIKTIKELRQLPTNGQSVIIGKMLKEERGSLIMILLQLLNANEQDITSHPYLIQAHERAKRAEAKLRNSPDRARVAIREAKDAKERMENALNMLAKQQLVLGDERIKVHDLRKELKESEDRCREQLDELETALNREKNEQAERTRADQEEILRLSKIPVIIMEHMKAKLTIQETAQKLLDLGFDGTL